MLLNAKLNEWTEAEEVETPIHLVSSYSTAKATFEKVAVVGLGYVGLPLAVCLAREFQTVRGFDISNRRVTEIEKGHDNTNEIDELTLTGSELEVSNDIMDLADASFYIVTVPTPINEARQPNLSPLRCASEMIGPLLKKGDVVVFESTVYPGVTEDYCVPILESTSGLKLGEDFGVGYSPERINPGDKENTVENIVKIVSGDTPETLERVKAVYGSVIQAELHAASNIKVAEAAKVLENTQRDINIALMNEMSMICDKVGINTNDVIEAAATKWNFMPFTPGLVGGHCIGVDPYYLACLAEQVGHHPQVILAGRRTNDGMVRHIADATLRLMIEKGGSIRNMRVGVCGITFKENVPDVRNSKSLELIAALQSYGLDPIVHDPHCAPDIVRPLGIKLCSEDDMNDLDVMVMATPHEVYLNDPQVLTKIRAGGILIDVRGAFRNSEDAKALTYWSL